MKEGEPITFSEIREMQKKIKEHEERLNGMNKTEQLLKEAKDLLEELVIMHSHCALVSMAQRPKDGRKEQHTQRLVEKAERFLNKWEKHMHVTEFIEREFEDVNRVQEFMKQKLEENREGWISTDDRLPEEGKYVLAKHNRKTWIDKDDQENVNCVVVKLVKGLSKKLRRLGKQGKFFTERAFLGVPVENWNHTERWDIYKEEDEYGNNKKPYCWKTFGPTSFNGQEITHWMEIPNLR